VQVERITDPDAQPQIADEAVSPTQSAQDDDLTTFTLGTQ
jgi:hypothetical protein